MTQFIEGELGASLQIHALAALRLMADAVDLDSRMPATWAALAELRLEVWVARKMAGLTMRLSAELALWVDAQVASVLSTLPPGRLLKVVEAKVVEADQELADRAAQRAAARGVWTGRPDGEGNTTLFARADAAGVQRLMGMVEHVARLLREHCRELAEESLDQLEARALVVLGNPLAVL